MTEFIVREGRSVQTGGGGRTEMTLVDHARAYCCYQLFSNTSHHKEEDEEYLETVTAVLPAETYNLDGCMYKQLHESRENNPALICSLSVNILVSYHVPRTLFRRKK